MFNRKAVDLPQQLVETCGAGVAVPPRAGCDAELLDDPEGVFSLQPPDDSTECASEPADVFVERKIFFSRRGRGGHGGKISP